MTFTKHPVHVAFVVKSESGAKLRLYDEGLSLIESEEFPDIFTLNFHLQTLTKKYGIPKGLMVIHDWDKNRVDLSLAQDEHSFFVSQPDL